MKLLVVDDSDAVVRTIKGAVGTPDHIIETAGNGLEALRVIERFEPDAVTMDISMPEMDGLACIEAILERYPQTRILVITGVEDKPTAVEAVRRGAQGYLFKPFSTEELSFELDDLFA